MVNFRIINNASEIKLDDSWKNSAKFKSENRIVDDWSANTTKEDSLKFRLISKYERNFPYLERLKRCALGTFLVIISFGFALFNKDIQHLFTKKKETIRFAILHTTTPQIKKIDEIAVKNIVTNNELPNSEEQKVNPIIHVEPAKKIEFIPETIKPTKPKVLFGWTHMENGLKLNFALNDDQKLVAITRSGNTYDTYEGSPLEALLTIAQDERRRFKFKGDRHYKSPIKFLLKHPNNSIISEEEFLKFISDNDVHGNQRISTLNKNSTLDILNLIQEKKVSIHLEPLLKRWSKDFYIIQQLVEMDPSIIHQIKLLPTSLVIESALNANKRTAFLLLNEMEKQNIALTDEESWVKKILDNDCEFPNHVFIELERELKIKLFFIANALESEQFVTKLKTLGMEEDPVFKRGPGIFARNMDIVTIRDRMEKFLRDLRKDDLLLKQNEFNKLNPKSYVNKNNSISRIQGRNFIEKIIKENNFKYVKVPKKILVIGDETGLISFHLNTQLEMKPKENVTIYAERVEEVKRKLSLDEALELMIVLEKAAYKDFFGHNFLFAEDGIYIVDTDSDAFGSEPLFNEIESTIKEALDDTGVEKFMIEFEKRKEAYEKEDEFRLTQNKEYDEFFKKPYIDLTSSCFKQFEFPLKSLL